MSNHPNVLLITADQWSGRLLGCAGHPAIQTSTLDELALNGVRFTNAYTETPICGPARRALMTGTGPRHHGDRIFKHMSPMPDLPTMAETFRNAGYQAFAVGKLHVYPQRDRIGFDDVILDEEGRLEYGVLSDYEIFLGDRGYAGRQFDHGMGTNHFSYRPWHLPEEMHPTNWATREMARTIRRRDPTKPAFWYLSYRHPHPPLVPLQSYLDIYQNIEIDNPQLGTWCLESGALPYALRGKHAVGSRYGEAQIRNIRRAYYALCTHIDHQLRAVVGTLREEGILDETIICFTADHGEMLGDHYLWQKSVFYERSANIPMILLGTENDQRVGFDRVDDRLVGLQDVMPTLLDLAGVAIPQSVEGMPMLGEHRRNYFYGEFAEDEIATRMVHDGRYKLIYYPFGNRRQLFDLMDDPTEMDDLSSSEDYAEILDRLTVHLISQLYGSDEKWLRDDGLIGLPEPAHALRPSRDLNNQRGYHWPPPPSTGKSLKLIRA